MSGGMYDFLILILVVAAILAVLFVISRVMYKRRNKIYMGELWGIDPDRDYSEGEIDRIRRTALFLNGSEEFCVDDITWNDLEMDRFYASANHTFTGAGDSWLYYMFRMAGGTKENNAAIIDWMQENEAERERLAEALYECGRVDRVDIKLLLKDNPFKRSSQIVALLLCGGLVLSIVLLALGVLPAVLAIVVLFFTNIIYSFKMEKKQSAYVNTLGYMVALTKCAAAVVDICADAPDADFDEARRHLARTAAVRNTSAVSMFYNSDSFLMMLNKLFVLEAISFTQVMAKVGEVADGLIALYRFVGKMDAAYAAASYRKFLGEYCKPELFEREKAYICFEGIYHPLMKNAVKNDFEMKRDVLITGSNATGKSTFLKAVAINAIMAHAICTCAAKSWRSSYLNVYTSMALRDNIFADESYFVTEVKAVKRMLDARPPHPRLCVIDEILRGTNTGERIAAASGVLSRLAEEECLCIAATHDLELAFILEDIYENLHFTEQLSDGGISFDYKLRHGRSNSRNAIKLLGIMGFEKDLVAGAEERFEKFSALGRWEKLTFDKDNS